MKSFPEVIYDMGDHWATVKKRKESERERNRERKKKDPIGLHTLGNQ